MTIPTEKAYETLNLPIGASKDAIEQSYKKLAFKWHPEKYTTTKNTQEALKKFKSINIAYRKLIHNGRDEKDISLHEMFEQYRQVFHNETNKKKDKLLSNGQTFVDIKADSNNNFDSNKNKNQFGNEININSLKNMPTIVPATTNSTKKSHHQDKNNNNEEENYENQYQLLRKDDKIDQTILSVKLKVKMLANKGNELAKQNEFFKAIEKFSEAIRYDSSDHRLFGNRSYCYDKVNQFQEGLRDAERAISLEPGWQKGYFRKGRALFGLKMYKEAEKAYEQVLEFENMDDPELEEELFKVRVLQLQEMGFSKLQSEIAIRNNGNVQVALESIFMYSKSEKSNESCSDIDNNELDYIENDSENGDNNSNNNEYNNKKSKVTNKNGVDLKSNAHGENGVVSTSLWIGNVDPNVSEETLNEMFAAFGPLSNVRCLPEKYCAFVNFKLKEDAQKAMLDLQGKNLEGQRLLIKYPDNPNTALLSSLVLKSQTKGDKASNNIEVNNSTKLKKQKPDTQTTSDSKIVTTTTLITTSNNKNATTIKQSNSNFYSNNNNYDDDNNGSKLTGPVNGNECYFWRTTGCLYAEKCRYDHIKKSKGCDKKPWHK